MPLAPDLRGPQQTGRQKQADRLGKGRNVGFGNPRRQRGELRRGQHRFGRASGKIGLVETGAVEVRRRTTACTSCAPKGAHTRWPGVTLPSNSGGK